MNQNDQLHGAEFEVNSLPISDEDLDAVAGGQEIIEMPDGWQEGITPIGAITEA